MALLISLVILGLILLIFGANWLVIGASTLAKRYNISDLTIGLTIVAFGTSAPELVINGLASMNGLSDIVYGNIIGSNAFNLFVILGIVGLIMPISVQSSTVWKEIPYSLFAIVLVFILSNKYLFFNDPILSRTDAFILLIFFFVFLYYALKQSNSDSNVKSELDPEKSMSSLRMTFYISFGLILMIIGGKLVVDNAVTLATSLGVSKKIIGLTIVAAGTSLPELVTSITAALKKNSDMAIGNVIGSNIFNLLLILPFSAVISPITYNDLFNRDILLVIAGTLFLFIAMFMSGKRKLDRWEAAVLLIVYIIYIGYQVSYEL